MWNVRHVDRYSLEIKRIISIRLFDIILDLD